MKRSLKHKKDEPLWKWVMRLKKALDLTDEQAEAMVEVSKVSWLEGMKTAEELVKKYSR